MRCNSIPSRFRVHLRAISYAILCSILPAQMASAGQGDPIALTATGSGLEIETMWNFRIVIGTPDASVISDKTPTIHVPDFVLSEDATGSNARSAEPGKSWTLQRKPDQIEISIIEGTGTDSTDNDVVISSGKNGTSAVIVDGVAILDLTAASDLPKLTQSDLPDIGDADLIVPVLPASAVEESTAAAIKELLGAESVHRIVVIADDGKPLAESTANAMFDGSQIDVCSHNRTAISTKDSQRSRTRVTLLSSGYYELNEERTELFRIKETACSEAQKIYAKLSAAQLNFKPANGTHSPRWNAEHLMGRELVFFSQIMAQIDSSIEPINLNPKQMPPEYEAAHPEWSGVEEAAQMQRVSAFTRRFAYLLHDVPMDQRAPGSPWTLRRLLMVMPQHYASHTANVEKKFELEGFPAE